MYSVTTGVRDRREVALRVNSPSKGCRIERLLSLTLFTNNSPAHGERNILARGHHSSPEDSCRKRQGESLRKVLGRDSYKSILEDSLGKGRTNPILKIVLSMDMTSSRSVKAFLIDL